MKQPWVIWCINHRLRWVVLTLLIAIYPVYLLCSVLDGSGYGQLTANRVGYLFGQLILTILRRGQLM